MNATLTNRNLRYNRNRNALARNGRESFRLVRFLITAAYAADGAAWVSEKSWGRNYEMED